MHVRSTGGSLVEVRPYSAADPAYAAVLLVVQHQGTEAAVLSPEAADRIGAALVDLARDARAARAEVVPDPPEGDPASRQG